MKPKISFLSMLCVVSLYAGEINIAAAANLSYAIEDLRASFQGLHPEIEIKITLGGTGKLTAQVMHGAPYDLLMAADMFYPQKLYANGLTIDKPKVYAKGALALLGTQEQNLSMGLKLLLKNTIQKIAIANPKTAPYGRASFEALRCIGVLEQIKGKFVYGESIAQTLLYTTRAADVGLVALSSLHAPQMKQYRKDIHWIEVPKKLYTPISQSVVLLKSAQKSKEAKIFYDFIFSAPAREVFAKYGYTMP